MSGFVLVQILESITDLRPREALVNVVLDEANAMAATALSFRLGKHRLPIEECPDRSIC